MAGKGPRKNFNISIENLEKVTTRPFLKVNRNTRVFHPSFSAEMDPATLAMLLKQTLDPAGRAEAETKLKEVHKIIGFCPGLLHVVMTNTVDSAVRQAGVIYFKNLVSSSWVAKEAPEPNVTGELTFTIHEQDKALVRKKLLFMNIFLI